MFSEKPFDIQGLPAADIDRQILRTALMAEFDAISLYEQMAAKADDALLKATLEEIARDEKVHVGQFKDLLCKLDSEQDACMDEGAEEDDELTAATK